MSLLTITSSSVSFSLADASTVRFPSRQNFILILFDGRKQEIKIFSWITWKSLKKLFRINQNSPEENWHFPRFRVFPRPSPSLSKFSMETLKFSFHHNSTRKRKADSYSFDWLSAVPEFGLWLGSIWQLNTFTFLSRLGMCRMRRPFWTSLNISQIQGILEFRRVLVDPFSFSLPVLLAWLSKLTFPSVLQKKKLWRSHTEQGASGYSNRRPLWNFNHEFCVI